MSTSAVLTTASANAPSTILEVKPGQVLAWLDSNEIVLVDVRETIEYETDHIPGALLCPLSTFEADLFPRFPRKGVVIHCAVGKRSAAACKQLQQAGYAGKVFNMAGGIDAWKAFGGPTEVQPAERKEIPFVEGSRPKHEPHADFTCRHAVAPQVRGPGIPSLHGRARFDRDTRFQNLEPRYVGHRGLLWGCLCKLPQGPRY